MQRGRATTGLLLGAAVLGLALLQHAAAQVALAPATRCVQAMTRRRARTASASASSNVTVLVILPTRSRACRRSSGRSTSVPAAGVHRGVCVRRLAREGCMRCVYVCVCVCVCAPQQLPLRSGMPHRRKTRCLTRCPSVERSWTS